MKLLPLPEQEMNEMGRERERRGWGGKDGYLATDGLQLHHAWPGR